MSKPQRYPPGVALQRMVVDLAGQVRKLQSNLSARELLIEHLQIQIAALWRGNTIAAFSSADHGLGRSAPVSTSDLLFVSSTILCRLAIV